MNITFEGVTISDLKALLSVFSTVSTQHTAAVERDDREAKSRVADVIRRKNSRSQPVYAGSVEADWPAQGSLLSPEEKAAEAAGFGVP